MGMLDVFGLPDTTVEDIDGRHLEAFRSVQKLYADRVKAVRKREGAARVLDFGTGRNGVARTVIEPQLTDDDMLGLYDAHTPIEPPRGKTGSHSRIIDAAEAYGKPPPLLPYGMVSLSYVLCMMEEDEAVRDVRRLRGAHPYAEFVVIDYMLKGREQLADLLCADEEMTWRMRMGHHQFVRTHTRFDVQKLCGLLWDAQLPCSPQDAVPLDKHGMRAAVVIPPVYEPFAAW
jgi:hypothetical protein